jgi:multiple sugar transport system permease protein
MLKHRDTSSVRRGGWRRMLVSDRAFGLALISPALIVMALVVFYPMLQALNMSMRDVQLINPGNGTPFVGIGNYRRLVLFEPEFWDVWKNTLFFVVAVTTGAFLNGLAIALLLRKVKRGRGVLRTLFLLPYVMPTVATSLLWLWMFNPSFGVANYLLDEVGVIDGFKSWFSDPWLAFLPVILLLVWKGAAFQMVMITAGLSRVPTELYEAVKIDGGGALRQFWHVTLPSMRPVLVTLLLLSAMFAMQQFSPLWLLSQGGPGFSTTTTAVWAYRLAFERYDFGLAGALGTTWLTVLATITALVVRFNPPTGA